MKTSLSVMVISILLFLTLAGAVAADTPHSRSFDGPKAGPKILYWPKAYSPQLDNVAPWKADPILISGSSAYRKGEFLYQDYLYDDFGAKSDAPSDPIFVPTGRYHYPTDPKYARNAADFVEIRLQPLAHATAVRITYNSMHDPELVATTIALGNSAIAYEMPHGANARAPAKVFVTVHGTKADVVDAATGLPVAGVLPSVSVSLERRQVDVSIPFTAFDPQGKVVRVAAATGLWDTFNNKYLIPASGAPTATQPGGAGSLAEPTAFFNVAFRYAEPHFWTGCQTWAECSATNLPPDTHGNWAESQQAAVLATGDLSPFFANVDFRKLVRHDDDEMHGQPEGVPESGFMNRIRVSHFESAQGRGNAFCFTPDPFQDKRPCNDPPLSGRLQPYGVYVPTKSPPPSGYGLTIDLPSGNGQIHRNTISGGEGLKGSPIAKQLGERGSGSIVIGPNSRDSWFFAPYGTVSAFEAWADIVTQYNINLDNVVIHGISGGGHGTYKFAAMFPDLFVAAAPIVACVADAEINPNISILPLVPSYRHVPIFSWDALEDPVCLPPFTRAVLDKLAELGYRHKTLTGPGDHGTPWIAGFEDYSLVTEWLESQSLVKDPAHVTYVMSEHRNYPEFGVNADHAYWVSELALREKSEVSLWTSSDYGTVDVFSHGFGVGDAPALPTVVTTGVINSTPPWEYTLESTELGAVPAIPVQNRLDIKVRNIKSLTIDPKRAKVNCKAQLNIDTDGPVEVHLRGCNPKAKRGVQGRP